MKLETAAGLNYIIIIILSSTAVSCSWSKTRKIRQLDKAVQAESIIWIKPEEIVQRIGRSTKAKCDTRCRGE